MSELGQVLQRAREEKGISLDDIQKITKIQRRYLEAIERGHLHVLPGHFYARAFIKSYAEAVGLDSNHILSHFQSDLPAQPPQEQLERLRRRRAASANQPLQAGRWVTKTLLVLFVALIIGVIYMAFVNNKNLDTSPIPGNNAANLPEVSTPGNNAGGNNAGAATPPATPNTEPVTPPPTAETPPVEETKPALAFESQQGSVYNYRVSNTDKISIKLSAKDNCWVEIYKAKGDKKKDALFYGMVKKGEEKVIQADKSAYAIIGRPTSLVGITVNDAAIDVSTLKFFPSILQINTQPAPQQQ